MPDKMNSESEKKITPHETSWRKKNFPDIKSVKTEDIQCTACGDSLQISADQCFINRKLGTLLCRSCHDIHKKSETVKQAKNKQCCVMCGLAMDKVHKCTKKDCSYSVCQPCLERNHPEALAEIKKQKWECFVCSIKQLYRGRAIAAAVMSEIDRKTKDGQKHKHLSNHTSDDSDISSKSRGKTQKTSKNLRSQNQKKKKPLLVSLSDSESESENFESCFDKKNLLSKPSTSNTQTTINRSTKIRQTQRSKLKTRRNKVTKTSIYSDDSDDDDDISILQSKIPKKTVKKTSKSQLNSTQNKTQSCVNKLQRRNSNSSSDREFTKYKIIDSFVPLQRIVDLEKDYTVSPKESPTEQKLTKNSAFSFKNYVHHFTSGMKSLAKKILNDVEQIEKNYHYNDNLTIADTTRVMKECKNVIADVSKLSTAQDNKVVERYDNWCKKAKVRNIFINNNSRVNSVDTPARCPEKLKKNNVHIKSSDSEHETEAVKPNENQSSKANATVTNGHRKSTTPVVSDIDKDVFSDDNSDLMSIPHSVTPIHEAETIKKHISNDKIPTTESKVQTVKLQRTFSQEVFDEDSDDMSEIPGKTAENPENHEEQSAPVTGNEENNKNLTSDDSSTVILSDHLRCQTPDSEDPFDDDSETEIIDKSTKSPITDKETTANSSKTSRKSTKIQSEENVLSRKNSLDKGEESLEIPLKPPVEFKKANNDNNKVQNTIDTSMERDPLASSFSRTSSPEVERKEKKKNHRILDSSEDDEDIETKAKKALLESSSDSETPENFENKSTVDDGTNGSDNVIEKSTVETDSLRDSSCCNGKSTVNDTAHKDLSHEDIVKISEDAARKNLLETSSDSDHNIENNLQSSHVSDDDDKDKDNSERLDTSLEISQRSSSPEPGEILDSQRRLKYEQRKLSKLPETVKSTSESEKCKSDVEKRENMSKNKTDESLENDMEMRARKALLETSSDSDTPEKSRITNISEEKNGNSNEDKDVASTSLTTLQTTKLRREKFHIKKNKYWKRDAKLRMHCQVKLTQLPKRILFQHAKALKKSKEYLENKEVNSLLSIENLEKRKKKNHGSSSSSDGESSSKPKKKKCKTSEETILDHLKKVTEGNSDSKSVEENSSDDDLSKSKTDLNLLEDITKTAESMSKAALLKSSDSEIEEVLIEEDSSINKTNDKTSKKNSKTRAAEDKQKSNENNSGDDSKNKDDENSKWKRSKLLTSNFSSTDSEAETQKVEKKLSGLKESQKSSDNSDADENDDSSPRKPKKYRSRRRRLASDSDVKLTDTSDSDENDEKQENETEDGKKKDEKKKRKRKNKGNTSDSSSSVEFVKAKPKRKRIKPVADSDDSSEDGDEFQSSQGKGSGRKNIRKVLKDTKVADDTKAAAKREEERLRRMAERQKLYNEMYEARLANETRVDKLILDFDEESKEDLLSVNENLVKKLKPHQAKGIQFMWGACFESLKRAKTEPGSGCILAHCMGLGKSFQVVTLSHTLLSNSDETGVNTILIVAPLSTVLNWVNEFNVWLKLVDNGDDIEIYEMTKAKTVAERKYYLDNWRRTGGVLIMGYEMYRNLSNTTKKVRKSVQEAILKAIVDPGPDLVICDEGHLLKREDSAISKAMRRIRTLRRIVLTGTPLQNNLLEYHCMVQFVKPNLLGTKKEFSNRFVNPIQNGQFDDSTEYDVKMMKKRAHVLHNMLEGSVQRFDYSVLTPFLPPKQEYVILVKLTPVQIKLYQHYLDNFTRQHKGTGGSLFADFQGLQRIWTHPLVVKQHAANYERNMQKKRDAASDSEGSLRDFIDDGSDSDASSTSKSSGSDVVALDSDEGAKPVKRSTRANPVEEVVEPETVAEPENAQWWSEFVKEEDYEDMRVSSKLLILFDIIKESEAIGDKVLVFSQSLYSLSLIEKFLGMIDDETQRGEECENLDKHTGNWALGLDYFRLDGSTSADNRSQWVKLFNKPSNTRARLFLISTRAGGLGINLTAANRVVIFDASWNPSHDVQSIFRIYRFGQKKPCYVYRLLAAGTMEEKIYNRQVTKLSLSCRVVDEQQIERHFSNNDLAELYRFQPPSETPSTLALPKDRLLAEIFLRHKDSVETYHEHDSLLENIAEEGLDEEERKQAWLEYEEEKAGRRTMNPSYMNYQTQQQLLLMQQQQQYMMSDANVAGDLANLLELIRKDYPHLAEPAQKEMALRALGNMYNYVESHMTSNLNNPMNMPNFNNAAAMLTGVQPAAAAAPPPFRPNTSSMTQYQQMQYAQQFGNTLGSATANPPRNANNPARFNVNSKDDDVMEITPSSSRATTGGAGGGTGAAGTVPQPSSSSKSQEE